MPIEPINASCLRLFRFCFGHGSTEYKVCEMRRAHSQFGGDENIETTVF